MGDYLISSNTADAARKVIKQNLWHFFLIVYYMNQDNQNMLI